MRAVDFSDELERSVVAGVGVGVDDAASQT
jgi:hypothetical protein